MNRFVFVLIIATLLLPDSDCHKIVASGLSCDDISEAVHQHNRVRRLIAQGKITGQPKAGNLQAMIWDPALAEIAQKWANHTEFEHSKNRTDARFDVGENLYLYQTTDLEERGYNWTAAVENWFEEYKLYTYGPLFPDPKTGHYTQVIWSETVHVGCGATTYEEDDGWLSMLYVCNYGPTGNWVGELPYKTGDSCENLCCSEENHNCEFKLECRNQ